MLVAHPGHAQGGVTRQGVVLPTFSQLLIVTKPPQPPPPSSS